MDDKTLSLINKLHLQDAKDLVTYYPYDYRSNINTGLNEQLDKVIIEAKVATKALVSYFRRLNRLSLNILVEEVTIVKVVIFNRGYLKKSLDIGTNIIVYGKYNKIKNEIVASDIKIGTLNEENKITCVYHKVADVTDNMINKAILKVLPTVKIDDYIPFYFCQKYNFMTKLKSLEIIHRPEDISDLKQAKIRLKYEELFLFMFKIACLKKNSLSLIGNIKSIDKEKVNDFVRGLSFKLTPDQNKSIVDIYNDLINQKKMNRLIQGDVGSGKTIVAIIASYMNYLAGYQTAFMAPTEILAKQHYDNMLKLFYNMNIHVALLTSSIKSQDRKNIINELRQGNIDILVGTHSLLNEEITFKNLGLVITDEQQRFGVNQRITLNNKNVKTDCLYLSATPIPRSYALILYQDMQVSLIKSKPSNRKPVITQMYDIKEIKIVLALILEQLKLSHQIYVVTALINEETEATRDSVDVLSEKFRLAFPNHRIGVLHGKLDDKEKDKIMTDFKNHKTDILLATTVIEVGVDVANAAMMVIFEAENFGLSQLHQLRGRVGRGDDQSYCLLIAKDKKNPRLNILKSSTDGFEISEKDYNLRGCGDLFGQSQSGQMKFKIASLTEDYKILAQANLDATSFLDEVINNKNKYLLFEEIIKESINNN